MWKSIDCLYSYVLIYTCANVRTYVISCELPNQMVYRCYERILSFCGTRADGTEEDQVEDCYAGASESKESAT